MIEHPSDTFARWGRDARAKEPNGKATWWPHEEGGFSFWCTCTWGGSGAGDDPPGACMCGAKMERDPVKGAGVTLRAMPWLIENRNRWAEAMKKYSAARAAYNALPWWRQMFTKEPKRP